MNLPAVQARKQPADRAAALLSLAAAGVPQAPARAGTAGKNTCGAGSGDLGGGSCSVRRGRRDPGAA